MLAVLAAAGGGACGRAPESVMVATTSSVDDTGFLDSLVAAYRQATDVRIRPIVVGSGEALELGRRGDVDAIIAHSPVDELAFVAAGHGATRTAVFANDFVLVGPPADPAAIAGATDAVEALARIARANAFFISRGDQSGTHRREQELWRRTAERWHVELRAPRYIEAGIGMAETLQLAAERRAYTLADRATFALLAGGLDLALLFAGDEALVNEYSVMVVRGARHETAAHRFAAWLRSGEARGRMLRVVGADDQPLFTPVP